MNSVVECAGAPRDLGRDQGRACRHAVASRFAAGNAWERFRSRAGWPADPEARCFRDLWRHFPHQADRLAGLGSAARVPASWLAPRVVDAGEAKCDAVAIEGPPARLGRALGAPLVVRRSRPEGLFASVEVTRPWFPAALAGVNERGLAVAAVAGPAAVEQCAAPAWLLAQDCLERFEALGPALDWCCDRPGGGGGAILLAHADGDVAGVALGAVRRALPRAGRIVHAGESAALEKAMDDAPPDAAGLALALGGVAVDARACQLYVGGQAFSP